MIVVETYFFLFIIYSFCGWAIETTGEAIKSKKFVNRGFLIGPICPIYGFGATLINIFLSNYANDIFAVFGLSMILCGTLEYFTSWVMEKIFNARWWDYSNVKLNINGRVCLEIIALFGIAGVFITRFMNPFLVEKISYIPQDILNVIFSIFVTILIIDTIVSFNVMNKIKQISANATKEFKDNTEEISRKIRSIIMEKSMPYRRVMEAFPHAFADRVKKGKEKIVQITENIKNTAIDAKNKTIVSLNNAKVKTTDKVTYLKEQATNNFINFKETSTNISKERIEKIKKALLNNKIVTIGKKDNKKGTSNEKKG